MAICPATGLACIDDLCYGNGCLKLPGEDMLVPCPGCGKLVGMHGGDAEDCECDPSDWDEDMLGHDDEEHT